MRVLITGEHNYLRGRDNNEYHMMRHIEDRGGSDIKLVMDCDLTKAVVDDFNPDIVVSFNCGGPKDRSFLSWVGDRPVCLMIDDGFHFDTVACDIPPRCDAIILLVKWETLRQQYQSRFPEKIVTCLASRYVDVTKFHPRSVEKEYDIFFYGTDDVPTKVPLNNMDAEYFDDKWRSAHGEVPTTYNYYPLRKRLRDLFLKHKDDFKVNIFTPQGSWFPVPPIRGNSLSEAIAKSRLTICTRARSDTLLKKYLEVAASGGAILGNYPRDYKDMFDGKIVEVNEYMSDDEILDVVRKALDDPEGLQRKVDALCQDVHANHNYEEAYQDFINVISDILERRCPAVPR